MNDNVWEPTGGSSVPPIACFCGKCGAFAPKTYISYSRIALIGQTVLSQCCGHRLTVTDIHSKFPSALEACDVMPSRGNGREEVGPSGQTGDADALQPAEEAQNVL